MEFSLREGTPCQGRWRSDVLHECCAQHTLRHFPQVDLHPAQELAAPTALCKRDGKWVELPVKQLVVGDLIQLKGGDVIPADAQVCR